MKLTTIPVVEPIPLPKGTPEYEALRKTILEDFAASVPQELLLPLDTIRNPPKNVTSIPRQCGLLSEEELAITENYDVTSLAEAIASRKLTALAVATAFAKRAIIAHQLTSCLIEFFMNEALARAKELDDHLASTGKTVGPLHGVPVSIKSHIPVAGHWSDYGFIDTRVKNTDDCQMVSILRQAGAVFYCKTNQPQAIMHLESTSYMGRTLNPHNINLSAGGSTGGEAALIALRGSLLGVGTDIGGSVRGPSTFCGIYGFKPTSHVLPMKDFNYGGIPGEFNVICAPGPMCLSLRDMDLFMGIMSNAKPYLEDPLIVPIPWTGLNAPNGPPEASSLRIGIMMHDGVITPQPPVTKALTWAKEKLESAGFQVKPFTPMKVAQIIKNLRETYWPAGTATIEDHFARTGEPKHPLTEWILQDAPEQDLPCSKVWQLRVIRDKMRAEFAIDWLKQDVDVVLCPGFVGPASSHDTARFWDYTALWNYLDCPGVVFPTPVKALAKGEEQYTSAEPLSDNCEKVRKLWAEGDFEGAPINLQLVARKYHDNDLFAALGAVKDALSLQ